MTAVSGTVSLEFWTASAANVPVTVEIRQGNLTVQTTTVNLDSNGGYTVPLLQPLDYGTYSVTIEASHWLRAMGENITIPGGKFDTELKNGDATNDNVVDVADYLLVGETPMRLFLDTSATNGTGYTYKACVLNASGGETAFSPEVVLTPTAQNPTCTATVTSETGTSQATGAVWANLTGFSQGVEGLVLCLDGEYVDFSGNAQPSLSHDSECGRNDLRASLVVVWDADERYGFSDITPMTFDNEFSLASMSVPVIDPDMLETVLFACKLKEPQRFRVDVAEDSTGNVVKTWTSSSATVAVTYEWDGTDMYGTGV